MKKEIVRDPLFLSQVSQAATKADVGIGQDLRDTLEANRAGCVGLAANMIGVARRVIIVNMGVIDVVMYNPVMVSYSNPYQTEEGCLSLYGTRPTIRYKDIEVEFFDQDWKKQRLHLSGFPAQICQHELDHLEGRLI